MGTARGMSLQGVLLGCFLGAKGPVPPVRSRHSYPTESAVPGVLACSAREGGALAHTTFHEMGGRLRSGRLSQL